MVAIQSRQRRGSCRGAEGSALVADDVAPDADLTDRGSDLKRIRFLCCGCLHGGRRMTLRVSAEPRTSPIWTNCKCTMVRSAGGPWSQSPRFGFDMLPAR